MGYRVITTVVTPASNYGLVTLNVVRHELRITDRANDDLLRLYIGSVSAAIAQFCNHRFQVETVKDEIWPDRDPYPYQLSGGIAEIQLSRWPVVPGSISSVTENAVVLLENTDYRANYDAGSLCRLDGNQYPKPWPVWPIIVQYDGGYATIPADVSDAAVRMVKARYSARGRDPYLKQQSIPGVIESQWWIATGTEAGNMPPDVTDILDNYRIPIIA